VLTALWTGLGSEFARHWMARVLTPAFVFWVGGAGAVWYGDHRSGARAHGWRDEVAAAARSWPALPVPAQVAIVLSGLLLVTASALAAERLTLPLLRLLEGYWSRPRWLRERLVRHRRRRRDAWTSAFEKLATRQRMGLLTPAELVDLIALERTPAADPARRNHLRRRRAQGLDARQVAELGRARRRLRATPRRDELVMPTRLGDTLRAAEQRSGDKYGLDGVVCWHGLWLVLPVEVRAELVQARLALDRATRMWLWGALFVVWTPWTLWAVPIAVAVPALAYYGGMLTAAGLFGELLVAAYDLHRFRLYDGLRLPRPRDPRSERRDGRRVTEQLWGGLDEPGVAYVHPPTGSEGGP
jgi:hypothetical protein